MDDEYGSADWDILCVELFVYENGESVVTETTTKSYDNANNDFM